MAYRWERRPSLLSRLLPGLVLVLLAAVAGALLLNTPRVTAQRPPEGAESVSALSPITLTFSQPMDAASVQERLSIEPALPGEFQLEAEGTLARFTPSQPWPEGAAVAVWLQAGARSASGLPLLQSRRWGFTIGRPRVAYLAEGEGPAQVWAVPAEGGPAAPLTAAPFGVLDFTVSPDGQQAAYAALREDGGSDLRAVHTDGSGDVLLLACPGEACRAPQWSPAGDLLAFERGAPDDDRARVWLLDLRDGSARALPPEDGMTREARWSPDGRLLAYYAQAEGQIIVNDLSTGGLARIANASGEMGAWTRDGLALIFPEIVFAADLPATPAAGEFAPADYYSHLVRAEIATGARYELAREAAVEDASAVPAPNGTQLAFGRKHLDAARWTPGRQLWLMHLDGSGAVALTAEGDFQHSGFAWSPNSRQLIYTRFDLTQPGSLPEVWVLEVAGGAARPLASGGTLPAWLP